MRQTDASVRYLWLFRCTCMEPELDGDTRFTEMRRPEKYLHLLKTIILCMHLAKPKRKQSKHFQALCPATREKLLCTELFPCLLRWSLYLSPCHCILRGNTKPCSVVGNTSFRSRDMGTAFVLLENEYERERKKKIANEFTHFRFCCLRGYTSSLFAWMDRPVLKGSSKAHVTLVDLDYIYGLMPV